MISVDIFEQKRYTFSFLSDLFECDYKNTKYILKKLKEYGILNLVQYSPTQKDLSNLNEKDIEIIGIEEENYYYVFNYVGILIVSNLVIRCYPKYLKNNDNPIDEFKQIIKVIEKYNSKEQIIHLQSEFNEKSVFNELSIILYFLDDYYKNGLYYNYQKIVESNGSGEILWDKTINESYTLIHDNNPYYPNFYTKKLIQDNEDYFKLLHEFILTQCSKELENMGLLELFDLNFVELSDKELYDFGEVNHILYKITQELNVQFNSHNKSLLKAMYLYISHNNSFIGNLDYFSMFGTNTYNLIWEEMCSQVVGDMKRELLINLNLPKKLNSKYSPMDTLLSIIEKPQWVLFDEKYKNQKNIRTLEPDSITFYQNNTEWEFIIFDAKYYNLEDNKPGVESVTKQYLYELAYNEFIRLHGFENTKNCFLFPIDGDEIICEGYVKLDMLNNIDGIELKNIQIRLLPAKLINNLYLNNKKLDLLYLKL